MATKKRPILVRTFRGKYKLDCEFINRYKVSNLEIVYDGNGNHNNYVWVGTHAVIFSNNHIDTIARCKDGSDKSLKMMTTDVFKSILYAIFDSIKEITTFESTEDYKTLRRDVRNVLKDFVDIRREELTRKLFFDRVKLTNTHSRFVSLTTVEKTFGYFAVPKNGTLYTDSVKDLVLVKSDPRNGYKDIVYRTYCAIRDEHPEFDIFKKDPFIQLNKELTEDLIPYV